MTALHRWLLYGAIFALGMLTAGTAGIALAVHDNRGVRFDS